jgi:hypothetical protein
MLVGLAWRTAGDAYAALASTDVGNRPKHLESAEFCYREALAEWRAIESQPGFVPKYRKDMDTVSAALAAIERSKP